MAIHHYYVNILCAPPGYDWKGIGSDGVIMTIMTSLSIQNYSAVESVLEDSLECANFRIQCTGKRRIGSERSNILVTIESHEAQLLQMLWKLVLESRNGHRVVTRVDK